MTGSSRSIVVLGASGATGDHVIEQARARGLGVVGIVRDASRAKARPGVSFVEVPLSDVQALARAFAGASAVISTLGVARRTPDDRPSRHLPAIIEAMTRAEIERYVGISGAGLTLDGERKSMGGRIVSWIVRKLAPRVVEDKELEYATLRDSTLAWTLVRAPRLVDGPPTGMLELALDEPPSTKLTRGDMAIALLDHALDRSHLRQAPYAGST